MKVSIWGSCVTRDAFEIRDHNFEAIDYHARTSWVAQAAPDPGPSLDTTPDASLAGAFGERMVIEDVGRLVIPRMLESQPDLVVLDLIDERFDLLDAGDGAWVTASNYFNQTAGKAQLTSAPRNKLRSPERTERFRSAAAVLASRLMEALPETPIVLHASFYTTIVNDPAASFPAAASQEAVTANDALAALGRELQNAFGPRLLTFESDPSVHRVDAHHKWGLSMFHYEHAYYVDLLDALEAAADGRGHARLVADAAPLQPPSRVIDEATRVAAAVAVPPTTAARSPHAVGATTQAVRTGPRAWLARHAPESVKSAYRKVR